MHIHPQYRSSSASQLLRLSATGYALDVEIRTIKAGPKFIEIPFLDPYDMVSCLARHDQLHRLHGKNNLLEFWRRFSKVQPDCWVFQAAVAGRINLATTIPFYSHGDEGRGKRKKGILIWSMRGCVGEGTNLFKEDHDEAAKADRMGLNMSGSMTSRFLHIAVPKSVYGKNSGPVWDDIALHISRSYYRLQTEGFEYQGRMFHAVCLGLTGDNPFLAKAGHLERSFARVAKKTGDAVCNGICWQCLAGTPIVPFENLNLHPEWSHTMYETLPWIDHPPFLQGLQHPENDPMAPRLFAFDVWHNMHGGMAKHMIASTIAEIVPNMEENSLEKRIQEIDKTYQVWRKTSKLTLHCGHLDRELFGIESGLQVCPTGMWTKFNDSRILMTFLEDFLKSRQAYVPTEITEEALAGISAANKCFGTLYRSGFWLTTVEATTAGNAGMRFLASYARLACWTLEHGRIRYPLMPKIHYLHHAFRTMLLEATHLVWVPNALGTSVQLDEDFVGRVARISRRVGSGLLMQRTLERYLVAANLALFPEEEKTIGEVYSF